MCFMYYYFFLFYIIAWSSSISEMVVKHCCWGVCKTDSRYNMPEGVTFHPFPKPGRIKDGMTELQKREIRKKHKITERWLYLCGRKDFTSIDQVTKDTYICSLHFVSTSGPTDEHPEPFLASLTEEQKESRLRKKLKRTMPKNRSDGGPCSKKKKLAEEEDQDINQDQAGPSGAESTYVRRPVETLARQCFTFIQRGLLIKQHNTDNPTIDKESQTIYGKYMLQCKIDQIIERNAKIVESNTEKDKQQVQMSPDFILSDSKKTKYFIGLTPEQFYILFRFLGPARFNLNYWKGSAHNSKCKSKKTKVKKQRRHFSPKEELFITLLKLRRGFGHKTIAHFYDVSTSLISSIFITWIQFLYLQFRTMRVAMFPTRDILQEDLPRVFKPFKNVRCSIDCTEFFCETPRNYAQQGNVFSNYKHHTTFKGLIAVTPKGAACFISELFEGSIDDVEITKRCGILDYIQPGDVVLVDKGFRIQELLYSRQATIAIPAFLGKRDQLTKEEELTTRRIAKARIHVERFNDRIKKFRLIGRTIPLSLTPLASQLVYVACCLVNFQKPLCK